MAIDKVKLPDNSVEEVRDSRIPGIDSAPTANSANLVTSGGVKSALDGYLPLTGGTMSNTNLVTNLNADLLDGKHASDFIGVNDNAASATVIKETTLEDEEFAYQATPVHDIADAYRIDRIKGRTLAFNQLIKCDATYWPNGNGSATFDGTTITLPIESAGYTERRTSVQPIVAGHVYYSKMTVVQVTGGVRLSESDTAHFINTNTTGTFNSIVTANETASISMVAWGSDGDTAIIKDVMLIDLTLMFGAGNEPSTVAEFEAMFPLPYYGYNEGELINNSAEGIETVGFNLWDEEWELGYWENGVKHTGPDNIMSKNLIPVIPGEDYYIKSPGYVHIEGFDAAKQFIGFVVEWHSPNFTFTIPAGCSFVAFYFYEQGITTYANDVCTNLSDTSRNGTYEPHWSKVLPLGLDAIKVKSHNLWDEEWENGYWNTENGEFISLADCICNKNPIRVFPFTSYYIGGQGAFAVLFYDKSGNYIGYETPQATFTAPQNAYYLNWHTFAFTTYNHNICINVSDPAFNGQYEPHGVVTVNGLASAGDVRDEIRGGKYTKRVGRVDLGTLDWGMQEQGGFNRFNAANISPEPKNGTYWNFSAEINSKGYDNNGAPITANNENMSMGYYSQTRGIYIRDDAYSTVEAFAAAMSGVMFYFELATPVEYELVAPMPFSGKIDGYGTMRVISDNIVAPFNGDITYGCNPGQIAADSNALMEYVNSVFDLRYYETSEPSGGMLPNREYQLGTLSGNTTFTLAAGTSGVTNHYFWSFDTGSTAPTITWPSGITSWYGGSAPTINASKHYEVSVLNGVAVVMEV